ncbi:MAG TPA: hypothetical protein DCW46_04700 [Desulfotomaculum sp.]|nr:hypothetical protein [Desulfotomaculum sp.]HAU31558.1 hypothetical protein [Desulfotomaculum sp.]
MRRTASENLSNTLRILQHNKAYGIMIYRFFQNYTPGYAPAPYLMGLYL